MNAKKKVSTKKKIVGHDSTVTVGKPPEKLEATPVRVHKGSPSYKKKLVNEARGELKNKPITMSTMLKLLLKSDMSVWEICRWTGLSPTLFEDIDDDEEIDPRVKIKLNKLSARQGLGVEL
jgi:hypothetical protein